MSNYFFLYNNNSYNKAVSPLGRRVQVLLCSLFFQVFPTKAGRDRITQTKTHTLWSKDVKAPQNMFITSQHSCLLTKHRSELHYSNHLQKLCVCLCVRVHLGVLTVGPVVPGGPSGPSSPCRDTQCKWSYTHSQTCINTQTNYPIQYTPSSEVE